MEIILLQNIEKVGKKHTIVKVKDGYGRNYLIPQGMALVANSPNRKKLEDLKRREAFKASKMLGEYQVLAEKLQPVKLKIGAKVGASGKIFGSVTTIQIANALKEQFDIEVDRRTIVLPDDVKSVGEYVAELDLHPDVDAKVNFEVVAE